MDLFLLIAIGGWLTLWLLREQGHFGVRRGMASAPRPSNPSSLRPPGMERIPPNADMSAGGSPHNLARHMVHRSSPLQTSPQQRSVMPGLTNHARSNP